MAQTWHPALHGRASPGFAGASQDLSSQHGSPCCSHRITPGTREAEHCLLWVLRNCLGSPWSHYPQITGSSWERFTPHLPALGTEEPSRAGQGSRSWAAHCSCSAPQQGLRALPCAGGPDGGVALTVAMSCAPPVPWGVGAGGTGSGLGSLPPAKSPWMQWHFLPGSSAWTGTEPSCARPN